MTVLPKSKAAPRPVWLDTDIIFNRVGRDVDDGVALMMLLQSPAVRIVGISLNIDVDNGAAMTQRFLDYYGRYPIPVYKGADDPREPISDDNEAVQALAEALLHGSLTVLALGVATNIAALLEHYPQAAANIESVIFCAGRTQGTVFTARGSDVGLPDANFDNNPQAMLKVIASKVPVVLAGFQAADGIYLYHSDINRIRARGRPGDSWVYRRLLYWWLVWKLRLRVDGFIPFDVCTIGAFLWPEYFEWYPSVPVAVSVRENDAKDFKDLESKPYLEVSENFDSPYRVAFAHRVRPEYKTVLLNTLLGTDS